MDSSFARASCGSILQPDFAAHFGLDAPTHDSARATTKATIDAVLGVYKSKPSIYENTTQMKDAGPEPSHEPATRGPSLTSRILRRLNRFAVVFCIGVGTTLAWQSYGDAARAMIATSSPQLGWLAPQTAQTTENTPGAAAAVSSETQELALSIGFVRQSLDQLALQIAAAQQLMDEKIAKVQTDQADVLQKLSAIAARPPAPPARKPAPVNPPSSASPQSLNPQNPPRP